MTMPIALLGDRKVLMPIMDPSRELFGRIETRYVAHCIKRPLLIVGSTGLVENTP
jgi:hypothetical protein